MKILGLSLRLLAAGILLQTLFFKFSAAPESVAIFTTLGVEPYGRIGSGVMELIAAALLLVPGTQIYGAALSVMIMGGAIMSHLLFLGVVIQDDGGLLFGLAWLVLLSSMGVLAMNYQILRTRFLKV